MSMKSYAPLAALASIALCAALAFAADGKPANGMSGQFYLFTREVPLPVALPLKQAVVGVGFTLNGKLGSSPHWDWNAGFDYGIGDFKGETTTGGVTNTSELSLTSWSARLGFDYWSDCCDEDWYCGPGFMYQSTVLTSKNTGSPDDKFDPIKVIGFDPHMGGSIRISPNAGLFGGMDMLLGYSSYDQTRSGTEDKFTGWVNSVGWRGGMRIKF
jgi:hypothetical protein